MKKLIYFSLKCLLTIPTGAATEVADPLIETTQDLLAQNLSLREYIEMTQIQAAQEASLGDQTRKELAQDLRYMTQERNKERATKVAEQQLIGSMRQEQKEARELTAELLEHFFQASNPQNVTSHDTSLPQTPGPEVTSQEEVSRRDPPLLSSKLFPPLPQTTIPLPHEREIPTTANLYTSYQHDLLSLWQAGKIGPKAWAALGGSNTRLAGAVARSIRDWPGQVVDIFYLGDNNFTLMINAKVQKNPYKY